MKAISSVLTLLHTFTHKKPAAGTCNGQWTLTNFRTVLERLHIHRSSPVYACQQLAPHLNNLLHDACNLLIAVSHAALQPINYIFAIFQPDPAALLLHAADRARPFQLLLLVVVAWVGGALTEPHKDTIRQVTHRFEDRQDLLQQTQQTQQQQTPARAQGPAASRAAVLSPVTCPPAPNVITLSDGDEVGTVQPEKTYLLQAGTYSISSTLQLNTAAQTTCFRGASRDSVTIQVATNVEADACRAIKVTNGVKLGLFGLSMDGQQAAPGVSVDGPGTALQAADVTFKGMRFTWPGPVGLGGAAVAAFNGAQVGVLWL